MIPLFYQPQLNSGSLSPEDSAHAIKVLRLGQDAQIEITDGRGKLAEAVISNANPKACEFRIRETRELPGRGFSVHLAIAPTKNIDRMEWLVEKVTEVGVEKISFIQCRTSERKILKLDRLEKKAVSALKQSRQAWLPEMSPMIEFHEFVAQAEERHKFIAYVDHTNPVHLGNVIAKGEETLVVIGPEGDFSSEELGLAVNHGFRKVSLGPNRLRTETAGLAAVMTINLVNQK